jgi:electron transport complex protein RnfC
VVTVAGPHVAQPANFLVPFGTRCVDLVAGAAERGALLVHGGPMAGLPCDARAVVTPATTAVLALEAVTPPLSTPCIRCGWCTDHCPARLNVAALNDAFELSLLDRARRAQPAACVECGVCSYVCPARLPLTHRVKQLKGKIPAPHPAAAAGPAIGGHPA